METRRPNTSSQNITEKEIKNLSKFFVLNLKLKIKPKHLRGADGSLRLKCTAEESCASLYKDHFLMSVIHFRYWISTGGVLRSHWGWRDSLLLLLLLPGSRQHSPSRRGPLVPSLSTSSLPLLQFSTFLTESQTLCSVVLIYFMVRILLKLILCIYILTSNIRRIKNWMKKIGWIDSLWVSVILLH